MNHTTFTLNPGIVYPSVNILFVNAASMSTVGRYIYSASAPTFYSGDASANVLISYEYTTTGEETISINNTSAGAASLSTIVLGTLDCNEQVIQY